MAREGDARPRGSPRSGQQASARCQRACRRRRIRGRLARIRQRRRPDRRARRRADQATAPPKASGSLYRPHEWGLHRFRDAVDDGDPGASAPGRGGAGRIVADRRFDVVPVVRGPDVYRPRPLPPRNRASSEAIPVSSLAPQRDSELRERGQTRRPRVMSLPRRWPSASLARSLGRNGKIYAASRRRRTGSRRSPSWNRTCNVPPARSRVGVSGRSKNTSSGVR